jgi:hypothetical protein
MKNATATAQTASQVIAEVLEYYGPEGGIITKEQHDAIVRGCITNEVESYAISDVLAVKYQGQYYGIYITNIESFGKRKGNSQTFRFELM